MENTPKTLGCAFFAKWSMDLKSVVVNPLNYLIEHQESPRVEVKSRRKFIRTVEEQPSRLL